MAVNKQLFLALVIMTTALSSLMSMGAIILCFVVLAYRNDCTIGDLNTAKGSDYIMILIYKQYIQDDSCDQFKQHKLTTANTIFVLASIWLAFALLNLVAALGMLIVTWCRSGPVHLMVASYWHMASSFGFFIIQLALATHFGMDYSLLTQRMDEYEAGIVTNYRLDTLRHGVFFLMCLVMKGFMAPAVNLLILPTVVFFSHELSFEMFRERDENHSIHSRGIIDAFDQPKNDNLWQYQPEWTTSFSSSSPIHLRPGMWRNDAGEPSPRLSDTNTRSHQCHSSPGRSEQLGPVYPGRQFRYLEASSAPPPSAAARPEPAMPHHQDLPVDIPAPDYSPKLPLKSALKSPYA